MGLLNFVNHFGTFLLFTATILLIVASISAPTVANISFLTVDLGDEQGEIRFGTFGWCTRGTNNDQCSKAQIGYSPADVISSVEGTDFSSGRENSAEALTNVMILHPIAAGLTFIGFLMSLGTGFFGSFLSSLVALSAFVVTVVALICDWVWMALIRNNVNGDDEADNGGLDSNAKARYDAALWLVLAAAVLSLVSSVILFFTCCAGRRNRSRAERQKVDYQSPPATTSRRRFWQRR